MSSDSPAGGRGRTYLDRAEEARRIAGTIADPDHRKLWESFADTWQRMAEDLVRQQRARPKAPKSARG